jgi:hypothetical protein
MYGPPSILISDALYMPSDEHGYVQMRIALPRAGGTHDVLRSYEAEHLHVEASGVSLDEAKKLVGDMTRTPIDIRMLKSYPEFVSKPIPVEPVIREGIYARLYDPTTQPMPPGTKVDLGLGLLNARAGLAAPNHP